MKSVIIGAGTYGEVYLSYLRSAGIEIIGFLDGNIELANKRIRKRAVEALTSPCEARGVETVDFPTGSNRSCVASVATLLSCGGVLTSSRLRKAA